MASHADLSVLRLEQCLGDGSPEPGAVLRARGVHHEEVVKDPIQCCAGNARPGVDSKAKDQSLTFRPFLRRGPVVLGWGFVITAVTHVTLGAEMAIRFGILHTIGVSVILAYPFLRRRWFNLGLGLALFAAGKLVQQISAPGPWLIWLGLEPAGHVYVD